MPVSFIEDNDFKVVYFDPISNDYSEFKGDLELPLNSLSKVVRRLYIMTNYVINESDILSINVSVKGAQKNNYSVKVIAGLKEVFFDSFINASSSFNSPVSFLEYNSDTIIPFDVEVSSDYMTETIDCVDLVVSFGKLNENGLIGCEPSETTLRSGYITSDFSNNPIGISYTTNESSNMKQISNYLLGGSFEYSEIIKLLLDDNPGFIVDDFNRNFTDYFTLNKQVDGSLSIDGNSTGTPSKLVVRLYPKPEDEELPYTDVYELLVISIYGIDLPPEEKPPYIELISCGFTSNMESFCNIPLDIELPVYDGKIGFPLRDKPYISYGYLVKIENNELGEYFSFKLNGFEIKVEDHFYNIEDETHNDFRLYAEMPVGFYIGISQNGDFTFKFVGNNQEEFVDVSFCSKKPTTAIGSPSIWNYSLYGEGSYLVFPSDHTFYRTNSEGFESGSFRLKSS